MEKRQKIFPGNRYGDLTVLESFHKLTGAKKRKRLYWRCVCDCGNIHDVDCGNLRNGNTHACPFCAAKKRSAHRKKPFQRHRVKNVRRAMIDRCTNPNNKSYDRYGALGVKVCDRWLESLENFVADMGLPDEGMSIDRIDPSGNYEPNNCRWVDIETQANNKRNTVRYEHQGQSLSLAQWCRKLGLNYDRTKARIFVHGMSFERAISPEKLTQRKKYQTPDGVFPSLEKVANYYGMSTSGAYGRFNSAERPDWVALEIG